MLRRCEFALVCLLGATLPWRWLEASMLRHMLIQLPLLLAAGWCFGGAAAPYLPRWSGYIAKIDQHGIFGLTALLAVSAYWMIPRALELSLTLPLIALTKYASLLATGAMLAGSLERACGVIQLFYLGNFSSMMAIAGIQYQNLPQRLCNAYFLDDQNQTGMALVLAALAVAAVWLWYWAPIFFTSNKETQHDIPNIQSPVHRHTGA